MSALYGHDAANAVRATAEAEAGLIGDAGEKWQAQATQPEAQREQNDAKERDQRQIRGELHAARRGNNFSDGSVSCDLRASLLGFLCCVPSLDAPFIQVL